MSSDRQPLILDAGGLAEARQFQMSSDREILTAAARAIGRIDRDGNRALTGLSVNEAEAMALSLVILGLMAIPPGYPAPETLINHKQKEATNGI
jgi:hypothetical protein